MAIVYEVNIEIDEDTATAYLDWLKPHQKEILTLPGFQGVATYERHPDDAKPNKKYYTVTYLLDSQANLKNYLDHHAPKMRQQGIDKFGTKMSATRRTLTKLF